MATKTRVSLDEFLALPDSEPPYFELMDGEAVQKPMAGKKHSQLVSWLIHLLYVHLADSGTADVDTELRHMERDEEWVFLPDISVTLKERLTTVSFAENRPVEVMPDFAIEVLSPDDRPSRLARKISHYMDAGVQLLWLVDPDEEQVTVWEPGMPHRLAGVEDELDASPVLPEFRVHLEELFARVREA